MSDLIRREDALRVTLAYASSYSAEQAETAIRALPAAQPDDDKLVRHMTKLIAAGLDRVLALTAERDSYRKALEDIVADCEAGYPPSHGAIKYAAKLALKGESQ